MLDFACGHQTIYFPHLLSFTDAVMSYFCSLS